MRILLGFAIFLVAAAPAFGQPLTYTFTGQVQYVTAAETPERLDLRPYFSLGQPVTFRVTIERSTPPYYQTAWRTTYRSAVTSYELSVGPYSWTTADSNDCSFENDYPYADPHEDQFGIVLTWPGPATFGTIRPALAEFIFTDVQGEALSATDFPTTVPDPGVFELQTTELDFLDDQNPSLYGYVGFAINGVSTPARPLSWGALKARFRR